MRRAGTPAGHLRKGGAHRSGDVGGAVDDAVPFRERPEQRLLVELGQRVAAAAADRDVGRDRQHRDRAFAGFDHPRQDVGGAAAARPLAYPDPAADPGIAVCHIGGRALVAGEDVGDALAVSIKRVVERQAGVAAKPKNVLDAKQLEHADKGLRTGHLVHRRSHSGGCGELST